MINRVGRMLMTGTAVIGAMLVAPATTHAQGKLELTPYFASYYALGTLTDDKAGDGTNTKFQQLNAPTYGGRLTYWVSHSLGLEASAGFTTSGVRAFSEDPSFGGLSFSSPGNILSANGRVLFRPARTNLHFVVGAGIVRRGGDAWKGGEELTKPAGILGVGVRAAVTPRFALNVTVEVSLYSFDPDASQPENASKFQSDVLVSIGVPIALRR